MVNIPNRYEDFEAGIRNVKNISKNSSYMDIDQSLEGNKICVFQDWISLMVVWLFFFFFFYKIDVGESVFYFPSNLRPKVAEFIKNSFTCV